VCGGTAKKSLVIVVNVVLLFGAQTTAHSRKHNRGFSGRREGLSSALDCYGDAQTTAPHPENKNLSGREGLSHGTDSVRLGRGKGHSASFGLPNFRIFLKTYHLNSSKLIMSLKVMRKNHKRRLLTLQAWNALKFLTISSRPQTLWGHAKLRGADLRNIFAVPKMVRRFQTRDFLAAPPQTRAFTLAKVGHRGKPL
jgi:hypothetical protein